MGAYEPGLQDVHCSEFPVPEPAKPALQRQVLEPVVAVLAFVGHAEHVVAAVEA